MTVSKYLIVAGILFAAIGLSGPRASAQPAADDRTAKIQAGAWFLAHWNIEAAPANFFHTHVQKWHVGSPKNKKLADPQFIDSATGLPHSLPRGTVLTTGYFWNVAGFEGTWILEAVGDARISAVLARKQRRISKNRIEIVNDASFKPVMYVQIDHIGKGGLQEIRLYRKEDGARLAAGQHWSSRFVGEASKYDVIRTMDLQNTNTVFINEASDVQSIKHAFWATKGGGAGAKGSLPLEALFGLGVEADNEIWFQAPIHLGYPYDWGHPDTMPAAVGGGDSVQAMQRVAHAHYNEIIESDEWDKYADNVVAALKAAGYPETRMIYVSLGNEIWNFGGWGFRRQTHYADGIGKGYADKGNRVAYGVLSARLMLALDAAFDRAGRNQARTHVIESQAANAHGTQVSLLYAKEYIEKQGGDWNDYAPRMGVSIASYWGARWTRQMGIAEWKAAIAADPDAAAETRANFIINGPVNSVGTLPWVMRQFARHKARAANFGVKLIGAYEGGSHDNRPQQLSKKFYNAYLWGPVGARVNQTVNDALIAAYPEIILSNYVLAGPVGGQPWHDGPIGGNSDMQRSWVKYQRK